MFRHAFVSILLSNPNIGVATVAAEAGRAQPSTTLAIYTQVYDRRRDEIRKQMSKRIVQVKAPIHDKKKKHESKISCFFGGPARTEPGTKRL